MFCELPKLKLNTESLPITTKSNVLFETSVTDALIMLGNGIERGIRSLPKMRIAPFIAFQLHYVCRRPSGKVRCADPERTFG